MPLNMTFFQTVLRAKNERNLWKKKSEWGKFGAPRYDFFLQFCEGKMSALFEQKNQSEAHQIMKMFLKLEIYEVILMFRQDKFNIAIL